MLSLQDGRLGLWGFLSMSISGPDCIESGYSSGCGVTRSIRNLSPFFNPLYIWLKVQYKVIRSSTVNIVEYKIQIVEFRVAQCASPRPPHSTRDGLRRRQDLTGASFPTSLPLHSTCDSNSSFLLHLSPLGALFDNLRVRTWDLSRKLDSLLPPAPLP